MGKIKITRGYAQRSVMINVGDVMKKPTKYSDDDLKILRCGAMLEHQEHPWATPAKAFQIAKDHGPDEYRNKCGKK